MVYPAGFEPAAFGSASQRSIQLSYGYARIFAILRITEVILSCCIENYHSFLEKNNIDHMVLYILKHERLHYV